MKTENNKLFGRWHEFSLLVLGSVLTLIGAVLVFELQSKEQQRQYELQKNEQRITDAREFLDGLSRSMIKQLNALIEVASMRSQTTNSVIIGEENIKVLQAQQEWGQEVVRAVVLTKLYFGDDLSKKFQDDIALKLTKNIYQKCLTISPEDKQTYQDVTERIGTVCSSIGYFVGTGYKLIDSHQLVPNH